MLPVLLNFFQYASLSLRAKDGDCTSDPEDLRPLAPVQDYELLQQNQSYAIVELAHQIPELLHGRRHSAPSREAILLLFTTTSAWGCPQPPLGSAHALRAAEIPSMAHACTLAFWVVHRVAQELLFLTTNCRLLKIA